jgi:hypothetical protein
VYYEGDKRLERVEPVMAIGSKGELLGRRKG